MTAPSAVHAEQQILSVMIQSGGATAEARRLVNASEFWQPRNQAIFTACCELADREEAVTPQTVLTELTRTGETGKTGGAPYLAELFGKFTTAHSLAFHAKTVREMARRRAVDKILDRLRQDCDETPDEDAWLTKVATHQLELALIVDAKSYDEPIQGLHTWTEFLGQPDVAEDWIVPGLLERQEVFLLLAGEGTGKSWLSRQLCQCIAAGIHPFRPEERIEPQRTLLVDLENPIPTVRRQARAMQSQVSRLAGGLGEAFVWMRPEGLNVRDHADARLLERVIAETRPAFVAIGSLYNAYQTGRDSWETSADEAKVVFNRLRAKYRVALWIEGHMPKGDGNSRPQTPLGSSVWMRWPSYGRALIRVAENAYELERSFRGDRDVRDIPLGLRRGGELPWSAIWSRADLADAKAEDELIRSASRG